MKWFDYVLIRSSKKTAMDFEITGFPSEKSIKTRSQSKNQVYINRPSKTQNQQVLGMYVYNLYIYICNMDIHICLQKNAVAGSRAAHLECPGTWEAIREKAAAQPRPRHGLWQSSGQMWSKSRPSLTSEKKNPSITPSTCRCRIRKSTPMVPGTYRLVQNGWLRIAAKRQR